MTVLYPALALALAVVAALPLRAGIDEWTGGGPEGGTVYDVVRDSSTTDQYYIATGNGVFRSSDGGGSWVRVSAGLNRTIHELAAADDGVVYALVQDETGALFKTSDAGVTWTELSVPNGNLRRVAVAPSNSSRVALSIRTGGVVGANELYLSTDGGSSFHLSGTGLTAVFHEFAFDPTTDEIAYCVTLGAGVFKSTDGGENWANVGGGDLTFIPRALAISRSSPSTLIVGQSKVAVSTDGGVSWTESGPEVGGNPVDIAPTDPAHMTAKTLYGFFLSADGGATWSTAMEDPEGATTNALAFDPEDPSRLLVATEYGVREWTDNGAASSDSSSGIDASFQRTRVAASSSTIAYESLGRLKTVNAGEAWTTLPSPVVLVDVDASDPDHVAGVDTDEIWETHDGGETWQSITPPIPDFGFFRSFKFDPYDAQRWVIGALATPELGDPALAISENAGATWQTGLEVNPGMWNRLTVTSVAFHPEDPSVLIASGYGKGLAATRWCWASRSADGGITWTDVLLVQIADFTCLSELVIDPTDGQKVYHSMVADGEGSLRRSLDGGQTWSLLTPSFGETLSVAVNPLDGEVYAGSDTLYRSADHGATWAAFPSQGLPEYVRFADSIQVSSTSPPTVWISTNAGTFSYTDSALFSDGFESGDTTAWSSTVP